MDKYEYVLERRDEDGEWRAISTHQHTTKGADEAQRVAVKYAETSSRPLRLAVQETKAEG